VKSIRTNPAAFIFRNGPSSFILFKENIPQYGFFLQGKQFRFDSVNYIVRSGRAGGQAHDFAGGGFGGYVAGGFGEPGPFAQGQRSVHEAAGVGRFTASGDNDAFDLYAQFTEAFLPVPDGAADGVRHFNAGEVFFYPLGYRFVFLRGDGSLADKGGFA
jgi:hypothetical protein